VKSTGLKGLENRQISLYEERRPAYILADGTE